MIFPPKNFFQNFSGGTLTNTLCHFQILKGETLSPFSTLKNSGSPPFISSIRAVFCPAAPAGASDRGVGARTVCLGKTSKSKRRTLRGEAKARANHCVPKTPVGRVFRHDRRNRKPSQRPSTEGHTASFAILRASGMTTPFAEGGPGYSRIGGEPRGGPAVPIIRYSPNSRKRPRSLCFAKCGRRSFGLWGLPCMEEVDETQKIFSDEAPFPGRLCPASLRFRVGLDAAICHFRPVSHRGGHRHPAGRRIPPTGGPR